MKREKFFVKDNVELVHGTFCMTLEGEWGGCCRPGQFVNLEIPGHFLRRPISICFSRGKELTLIYKVVGEGTDALSHMEKGSSLDLLLPLGNGYDLNSAGDKPLLIGGGVGVPPLYYLATELLREGIKPEVILGFNRASEVFCEEEFRALGCHTSVFTVDGSCGNKGFPTDGMREADYSYFYSCGPLPMLKAVYREAKKSGKTGELSLEERMGCGFGACMGCSMKLADGSSARVCKDGPVFKMEELAW